MRLAGAGGVDQRPQLHVARRIGRAETASTVSRAITADEIVLTNRTARLVFDVDSAQAEINGVNVRLSFPVANVKGVPFIAQLDLDKTVRPLLFPSRYLEPKKITTICLDPGHGGKDTGNRVGGGFLATVKKPTRWLWRSNCATSLKTRLQCHSHAQQGHLCGIARAPGSREPARRGFVREPAFQRGAIRQK